MDIIFPVITIIIIQTTTGIHMIHTIGDTTFIIHIGINHITGTMDGIIHIGHGMEVTIGEIGIGDIMGIIIGTDTTMDTGMGIGMDIIQTTGTTTIITMDKEIIYLIQTRKIQTTTQILQETIQHKHQQILFTQSHK